jgi:hypothetical protein
MTNNKHMNYIRRLHKPWCGSNLGYYDRLEAFSGPLLACRTPQNVEDFTCYTEYTLDAVGFIPTDYD